MSWQSVWLRLQSFGFMVFVSIVAGAVGILLFVPELHRKHDMQLELQRLDQEIIQQESLEKQQRQELEALKTDPSYVERTARNKLNLARPTETIFRFETAQSMPPPPQPAPKR